jgi:hypothetical protein
MRHASPDDPVPAVKDASRELPIPAAWRPALRAIVESLVAADYRPDQAIEGVEQVSAETALQIQGYVQEYGATLVALPDEAWCTSVCIWNGECWEALVDLWTREEGRSDLVLHARVRDTDADPGFRIAVYLVYVP